MKLLQFLKQRYVANTTWLMLERGLQMLITLYVGVRLAVYMSPEQWGFYNWAASLVVIFADLARVGLPNVTVKYLVNARYPRLKVMGTSFVMKLAGSLLSLVLIVLLAFFLEASDFNRLLVFMVAFPYLLKTLDVIMYYFEAEVKSRYIVISRFTGIFINNLIKLYIIVTQKPVEWVYFVFTIDAIIFISLLIYFYRKMGKRIKRWQFDFSLAKKMLSNSWPLIFSVMIYNLYMKIDQLMINELLGAAMNGHYAAAIKLSSAWYAIPWLITGSVFPAILKVLQKDNDLFIFRFKVLYEFLILIALVIIVPISFFHNELIDLIYSGKYYLAGDVLKIHIWASVFVFMGYAGTKWLIAQNLERLSFIFILFGCIINVISNYILIPKMGIQGAAWATLFSQFTSYILMPAFHKKTRIIFTTQLRAMLSSLTIVLPIKNTIKLFKSLKS